MPTQKFEKVPMDKEHWTVVYDGGGDVLFEPLSNSLLLKPRVPESPTQTFAALVTLNTLKIPLRDYAVRVVVSTNAQLRKDAPNDWEVFWFLGNFRWAPNGKKEANYFTLKPRTGAELGTVFDEVGQNFLKTRPGPSLKLGEPMELLLVKQGGDFRVYQGQNLILKYHDSEAQVRMFSHPGTFGLYSEDALVRIHSFEYLPL